MNANKLWAGSDYAHSDYVPRGERYADRGVRRVRVKKVTQKRLYGNDKATSFVEVWIVDTDTGDYLSSIEDTREVRARDIFMTWDEYLEESERRKRQRAQIEREREERMHREEAEREAVIVALESKGIPRAAIQRVDAYTICLYRTQLDEWLS